MTDTKRTPSEQLARLAATTVKETFEQSIASGGLSLDMASLTTVQGSIVTAMLSIREELATTNLLLFIDHLTSKTRALSAREQELLHEAEKKLKNKVIIHE